MDSVDTTRKLVPTAPDRSAGSHPALEIRALSFAYPGGRKALEGVHLSFRRGESAVLAGPNGSGKSTLLMHMAALFESESVSVFGIKAIGKKNLIRIRQSVGIVFQDSDDQLFMPTVFEDVAFGPLNQDLPASQVRSRTKEALTAVGLEPLADRPSHHLSGGEKKLAAVATVLSMHPRLLLLDEPTANLDHAARRRIIAVLEHALTDPEVTMVVATHDLELAMGLCRRAVLLNKGRIHADGTPTELFQNEGLLAECGLEPPLTLKIKELEARVVDLLKTT